MTFKLLTEHHLEFVSLKEGGTGSSESTHVKLPHCWKSRVGNQIVLHLHVPFLYLTFRSRLSVNSKCYLECRSTLLSL